MLKYLGTIGSFIRLNDVADETYQLLNVFSSSATNKLLFSASINNFTGQLTYTSGSFQSYVNGVSASIIPSEQWAHITFSFLDKLKTLDTNNFIIEFGGTGSSNFNIQNTYILEQSLNDNEIKYLHYEFTGGNDQVIRINDPASYSVNLIDYPEQNFISASTNVIYQPLKNQSRYKFDLFAVEEGSLSKFVSASLMTNDYLYIDGINISEGAKILSLADNQIYQLTASSTLVEIDSTVGDLYKILYGQYLGNTFYRKYEEQSASGSPIFLIAGSDIYSSSAIISTDQITWTQSSVPFSDWSSANIYQSGSFVLISLTGSVAVSTDGITWTTSYINAGPLGSDYFKGIAYGNGVFVTALSNGDYFYVSNNGLHWYSSSYIGMTGTWSKVGYGNGVFMAVAGDYYNDNEVVTSTDGINWTLLGDPPEIGKTWNRPVYGDNKWLLIRASDTFGDQSFYTSSNNGVTWTSHSYTHYFPYNNYIDPAYSNGIFIVASDANRFTDFVYYSSNGITWQTASIGTVGTWQDIVSGPGGFTLLSSYYGVLEGRLVTSVNGINWSASVALPEYSWKGIAGNYQEQPNIGFELSQGRVKVTSYVNRIQTNNV